MYDVIIVGAGAAGLMAAISASKKSTGKILVLEKNKIAGVKLYLTGKGRCNVTNSCNINEFLENIVRNPKFMYSSLNQFYNEDLKNLLEKNGCFLKRERGNRYYPESDKSETVVNTLFQLAKKGGVEFKFECSVIGIYKVDDGFEIDTNNGAYSTKTVIVATGGKSYEKTGSSGDGYVFAEDLGHSIVPTKPGLVGIKLTALNPSLEGLTLRNVALSTTFGKKTYTEIGEMTFTKNGITGPIVFTLSSQINRFDLFNHPISIDLKPAVDHETLLNRLNNDICANGKRELKDLLHEYLPMALIEPFITYVLIKPDVRICDLTKNQRNIIINSLKNFQLYMRSLESFDYAIITSGGVNVNEVNSKTMESKIIPGLYFAGEVLDVDAYTGGFNLQIAFSTGYVAGENAATKYVKKNLTIAIDGTSGSGKSSIATLLSQKLNISHLNSGELYRAIAYALKQDNIDINEPILINKFINNLKIEVKFINGSQKTYLNGKNVTQNLHTPEIDNISSVISQYFEVRNRVREIQLTVAKNNDVIMEGRDIGTEILPNATFKFFITASAQIRGERRYKELKAKRKLKGMSLEEVVEAIVERDRQDMTRKISPLHQAKDAILIDTSYNTLDEIVDKILEIINTNV